MYLLWCSFSYFPLKYLDRKSDGKIWDFLDKNLLQSSGIFSKTVLVKNHEVL